MKSTVKPTPEFKDEAEERAFWETHDSADYVDWSRAQPTRLPNLKPSTQAISLRLPLSLLEQIKIEANSRDVPYQSLIKVWLAERIGQAPTKANARTPSAVKRPGQKAFPDRKVPV